MRIINKGCYRLVDFFRKTDAISAFSEINKTQWRSKEELNELQSERLRDLLIHCNNNVPYYRQLFKDIGFNPEISFTLEDYKKIPLCTKDILKKNFESLKAKDYIKYKPRTKTTGGSTGQPIKYILDYKSHSYFAANNLRAWSVCSDYSIGDSFITIAHGSLLPKGNSLKNRFYFLLQNSILISSFHLNEEKLSETIKIINNSSAKFIYGYASTISMIARYAITKDIKIKSKLQAITTSDMLYPDQRELIERAFKIKVFDSYGCPESGLISFECHEHDGYHINQESAYIEVISTDENGIGKIVSTPLLNYAMPLIRYETGDVGKYSDQQCKCGRWLPRITELVGRIRDFVILEDGRYIHGAYFNYVFNHLKSNAVNDWIGEYQIIQRNYNDLLVRVTPRRVPSEVEKSIITRELKKGLVQSVNIEFDLNGVHYTSGGKFRSVITEVKTKWEG